RELERFSAEGKPAEGALVMRGAEPRPSGVPTTECGDVERFRGGGGELGTPVVRFTPGPETADDPAARQLRSVTTSKPTDPVPRTEVRISGGGAGEQDTSGRVTFGARVVGDWTPALTLNGQGGLTMAVGKSSLLRVDDALHFPPIGTHDPLVPDLMTK